jgi:cell division protein FtsA
VKKAVISKRDSIVKTALDIGNMKIKAVIGELSSDGSQLKVLGYAEVPSRGMKKSVIENPEELSQCVSYVLGQLRDQTGENIEKVSIGISGEAIKSRTTNMKYQFEEKEISEKEVETLFRMSAHELLSGKERILKKEIYNIRVNNSGIIKNPIGIVGKEIQGDVHLIYIDEAEVEKLVEVVNRAGVEVEHMLLNAYASAKAVLDDEDRRMGVALIDIGEGSTDIILFKNDKLIYTKSLPLGGMHYVNDISYLFQISKQEAFEILSKLRDKEIHDAHIYCGTSKKVAVDDIKNIIDARTGDIINFIAQTIEESGFNGYLGKGLVLTGGAVVIDGLLDKINKKTGYVVRKVFPTAFRGLEDVDSSQATVIGIFTEVMEDEYNKVQAKLNSPEPEVQEKKEEDIEESLENLEKILEEAQEKEKPEKKNGVMKGIKSWFSNFI